MSKTRNSMNRRLYRSLAKAVVLPIFILTLMLSVILAIPTFSWAANASSNQALNQSASLLAPEPDAKITVYLQPEVNDDSAGYGVNGDAVTVLEQVSDNQSMIWNHVRFDNPPYAEGWVQEAFLALEAAAPYGKNQQPAASSSAGVSTESRYLGNQRSQSTQQSGQQFQPNQPSQVDQRSRFSQSNSAQSYSQRNQN